MLLARVLCLEPRVLLLDDPTRGIDIGAKAEIQGLISDLAEAGLAVVLISSELEEVVEGSDRIIVLRDGAVVGTLSGAEVTQDGVLGLIAAAAQRAETSAVEATIRSHSADRCRAVRPEGTTMSSAELAAGRRQSAATKSSTGSPSEASTRDSCS